MELSSGVVWHREDDESSAVVEFAFRTQRVGSTKRGCVLGQLGLPRIRERHPRIADLVPCFATDFQRAVVCRLQRNAETCFWMWVSVPQNGETWAEGNGLEELHRTGTPQNHRSVGSVWPARRSRRRTSTAPSGPSSHHQIGPFPVWSFRWHPFHMLTSGARVAFGPQIFRVFLCFVAFGAVPLSSHSCRCGRLLDARGHHRAACGRALVLGRRGFPLESAAARVCREAGGRVSVNVRVADLAHGRFDNRKIEVVADGLPLFHGAQLISR